MLKPFDNYQKANRMRQTINTIRFAIFVELMKKKYILFVPVFICLLAATVLQAQVSHGGKPLPLTFPNTKTITADLFVNMPPFDIAEQLFLDSLNESDLRSGYRFAYKFMTDYTPANSGVHFSLPDGTRVWRLGIHSAGALSLNILFTEFEIPEGARLFLYNADQTEIRGSFNHLNNSLLNKLPIAPVNGDQIIIEYMEPAYTAFRGKLTIGEVNHGYRDFKGREPVVDHDAYWCMEPLACYQNTTEQYKAIGRSVVLLMIDGNIACTGALVNNTAKDGKPYLLTASHCLNKQFSVQNPDYEEVAGSIVCFFNYDSPLCNTVLRGTEEMSVASAHYRAVNEQTDMALLELLETPPVYYQPYYAGWNAENEGKAPYIGVHHPGGSVKRINQFEGKLIPVTYTIPGFINFNEDSHWKIDEWTTGSTAGGSSGSPLFDTNNRIVGALTGGGSTCGKPKNDFYYAFNRSWKPAGEANKQLKHWLNPAGSQPELTCDGFDPYADSPCYRLSNIRENGKADSIENTLLPTANAGYLFGINSLGTKEYAEAYKITGNAILYGAYFVNPSIAGTDNLTVEVTVYSGREKPETLLHTERFHPTYLNKQTTGNLFQETEKPLNRDQESFISFSNPVRVDNSFFIGYKISTTTNTSFSVFNLRKGETAHNTAWVNYKGNWTEAVNHPVLPFATSLFIDPVIQYDTKTANEVVKTKEAVHIFVGADRKTISVLLPENSQKADFTLYAIDGRMIQSQSIVSKQTTIQLSSIQTGVHFVKIVYNNKLYTQKVMF